MNPFKSTQIADQLGGDDKPSTAEAVEAPGVSEEETHGGLLLEIREGDGRGSD